MNNNLPHLIYFEIKNTDGHRIYTLSQNEIAFIEAAIYIPDKILYPQLKDNDLFICWTINGEIIEHDDIPVQEILQTNKHTLQITFTLNTHPIESIDLKLSLGAKNSTISLQEQIDKFSFFETIIKRSPKQPSPDEEIKKEEPPKGVRRFDNEDWLIPHSQDEAKQHHSNEFNKRHNQDKKN